MVEGILMIIVPFQKAVATVGEEEERELEVSRSIGAPH